MALCLISMSCTTAVRAGQPSLLLKDPEARWTLESPTFSGAPMDNDGTPLPSSPIKVITKASFVRSPAQARYARMRAQRAHLELSHASLDTLYCPTPETLPLHVKKVTQAL